MVASKKIHCAACNKKCSGNVLRYQDQYYHKQCFESGQSSALKAGDESAATTPGEIRRHLQHDLYTSPASNEHQPIDGGSSRDMRSNDSIQSHQSLASQPDHPRSSPLFESQSSSSSRRQLATSTGQISSSGAHTNSNTNHLEAPRARGMASSNRLRSQTIDARSQNHQPTGGATGGAARSATLPHSISSPANGFLSSSSSSALNKPLTNCAGCGEKIKDGQALIALDLHWHVWCFKCAQCQTALHGEYVAKDGKAYCERDYQKLFGVTCVYCKRYITGKVLQAGEAHHFHPSCARCSKCGDPFVPGEEMYLQGEVTWHPRCGPGPDPPLDELATLDSSRSQLRASRAQSPSLSSRSRSRSASPFSFMSRQYGRASPGYTDSEAVGDLSRIYTISYLNADPTQGYLRRPIEPNPPKSPQFSRPVSQSRDRSSRSSSRSNYYNQPGVVGRERSVPRGMYSVLSSMRSTSSHRARSPSMQNEEAIAMAQYPSGQRPSPDSVPKIERDDFPAPPFPYPHSGRRAQSQSGLSSAKQQRGQANNNTADERQVERREQQQQRASRPRSREIVLDDEEDDSTDVDPQLRKEEEELSKIANGIGKIFLQTLKEREKLRAWKRANLDPRNASRTPSATRELPSRPLRYDNPLNASPSRDLDRPRPWDEEEAPSPGGGGAATGEHSPTRTRSSLGASTRQGGGGGGGGGTMASSIYGYKVVQSNRSTPRPGYGLSSYETTQQQQQQLHGSEMSFSQQQRAAQNRSADLLNRAGQPSYATTPAPQQHHYHIQPQQQQQQYSELGSAAHAINGSSSGTLRRHTNSLYTSSHLRRSMPNVNSLLHLHQEGPPKLYPYHLLATSNYRLPPDVDRCHLERHLSNEEFQYIFHCDRLDFYRLPEWKRNELKRRARLF